MPLVRPEATVVIGGQEQEFLDFQTTHTVEGMATATVTVPAPAAAGIAENATVSIQAKLDTSHTLTTLFAGKLRGPLDRVLNESDATITLRCDGNLWRLALPATHDISWVGPITPKKIIKQMFLFRGVEPGTSHCERFIHPVTGVPILLGGIPWFDEGRVVCPKGTSPLAFIDRICRLFGYRIFDRPDGRILVSRVCGPPPDSEHTFTEGVDLLNVRRNTDLHPLQNYWIAEGASGTDIVGQAVAVRSIPRRGQRTKFIPNPPKWTVGTVSDPLLTTHYLASTARIVKELDNGGVAWNISADAIGLSQQLVLMQPRKGFVITAPTLGLTGQRFWQIGVGNTWGPNGFWTTIDGWRPTGKPRRTKPA